MKRNKTLSRLAALLLTAVLLLTLCPLALAEEDSQIIHIQTAEDLAEFSKNCTLDTWSQGITVELDADISLEGAVFTPIPSFGGTFHGNGHTISGLSLSGKMSHAGLFNTLQETALIQKLNVSGVIDVSGCEAAGGIAAVNNGTIFRCSFSGSITGTDSTGGIVGKNAAGGAIWNCQSAGAVHGDSITGGIVGQNLGLAAGCSNAAYVNTSTQDKTLSAEDISLDLTFDMSKMSQNYALHSTQDSGGIAGYNSGVIRNCDNTAVVGYQHIGYNVGGIAGRSCGYVHDCTNSGAVYGRKDVGGITGQMEPYVEMELSQSSIKKIQTQLNELNTLIDKAATDAEGGAGSVSARLSSMSGYVNQASSAAKDMKVVIDAGGSLTGIGGGKHDTDLTVKPGTGIIAGGAGSGASIDVDVDPGSVSIDVSKGTGAGAAAGATPSSASVSGSGVAGGKLDGAAQVVATPDFGGLTSAVSGIGSQISQLSNAMSGATGQLANDVRDINAKFKELSDTLFDAIDDAQSGSIISDTSTTVDIAKITLGKLAGSENAGTVDGDINVGGVAGSMAMEYALDPEDDVSSDLSGDYRRQYEVRAIIQNCTNTGIVTAKRSYTGGICGRMDLGLITGCRDFGSVTSEGGSYVGGIAGLTGSTVRSSFAKCTLSGQKYVGGIVGSGITETLTGSVSTVSGCYSMVEIQDAVQYTGAVSGAMAGDYLENYFVSDDLAGIDGQSYGGKAGPISYEDLLEAQDLPEEMQQLHLQFVADDTVLAEQTFQYGDSFTEDDFPAIPAKDGCYAVWDKTDLTDLHFDTVVTAVYTPYTTTVGSDARREDGKSVFLTVGDFDNNAALTAEAQPVSTSDFAPVSAGLGKAISHYLQSESWYALPGTPINRDVAEQWHITLPQDSQQTHTVHYLPTTEKAANTHIYICQGGDWEEVDCDTFGSYLTFQVTGSQADIAAVSVFPVWWAWVLVGLVLLGIAFLVFLLLHKLFGKVRARRKAARKQQITEAVENGMPMMTPGSSKPRIWLIVVAAVLAVILIAGCIFFFGSGRRLLAYQALNKLDSSELTAHVTVDAAIGETELQTQTVLQRKTENGQTISYVQLDGIPLYYANGAVILENGRAYRIVESLPDYDAMLQQLTPLYKELKATHEDGAWQITADGSTARQLLTAIVPELSGNLADTQQVTARVTLSGLHAEQIALSASGVLQTGDSFRVSLRLDQITGSADFMVPQAVSDAAASLSDDLPVITQDWLTLLAAWKQWQQQDQFSADIALRADCGPVVLNQSLNLYAKQVSGKPLYCISKDGLSIYWSGDKAVRQDGSAASSEEQQLVTSAQLLDLAYLACEEGSFVKSQQGSIVSYTMQLTGDTMNNLAAVVAPETSKLDLSFTEGTLTVRLDNGNISEVSFRCAGNVKVVVLDTSASLSGTIRFTSQQIAIPDAVQSALQ